MDWNALLERYALAVGALVATGVVGWRCWRWIGREILMPIRDRVIVRVVTFFDHLESAISQLILHDAKADSTLKKTLEIVKRMEKDLEETRETCDRIETHLMASPSQPSRRPPQPPQGPNPGHGGT